MFDTLRNRIANLINPNPVGYTRTVTPRGIVEKYDQGWFLRFMAIAHQEDVEQGIGVEDPMRQHAWVNIGVSAIARNISRATFQILNGDEPVETGPVYDLFTNVSPLMSRYQLWEATVSWKKARGEAFWIFEPGYAGGIPTAIYLVDPDYMVHEIDETTRQVTLWKYEKDRESIPFLPDELIHFKEWNKWDDYRGISPLDPLATEIVTDRHAGISNYRMIENGSRPDGVLTTEQGITEVQATEIRDKWEKAHRGSTRAHRISVLGYGTQWNATALSPKDMEYGETRKWNRLTILSKLGVLPGVVGVKDDMTPMSGADTKQQMKAFWHLTLIPEIRALEDKLRTEFFNRYKIPLKGLFDLSEIDELQEDEGKKHEIMRQDVKDGLLTQNEAREEMGRDPVGWGDTWWKGMALSDVSEPKPKAPAAFGKPADDEKRIIVSDIFTDKVLEEIIPSGFPKAYRVKHWWMVIKAWENQEDKYLEDLKAWFFDIRSRTLSLVAGTSEKAEPIGGPGQSEFYMRLREIQEELIEARYFNEKAEALGQLSQRHFIAQMDITGAQIIQLFKDMGLDIAESFSIYDTNAVTLLQQRVTLVKDVVTETMRNQLRDALKDALEMGQSELQTAEGIDKVMNTFREPFVKGQHRAATIARTELGGVIGDSRQASFLEMGFEWKEWLSAQDSKVRIIPDHTIDGEPRHIEETFSNGLLYPNDPNGAADNVINCRCLHLPLTDRPQGYEGPY